MTKTQKLAMLQVVSNIEKDCKEAYSKVKGWHGIPLNNTIIRDRVGEDVANCMAIHTAATQATIEILRELLNEEDELPIINYRKTSAN